MIFINTTIIISLFLDYIRQALFGAYIDPYVDALLIIIIVIFCSEIVIYMVQELEYFSSFYFYLDLATTVLLIFDI